jgi:hypothetical protein
VGAQWVRDYGCTSNAPTSGISSTAYPVLAVATFDANLALPEEAGGPDLRFPSSTTTPRAVGFVWVIALASIQVALVVGTPVTIIAVDVVQTAPALVAIIVGASDAVVALFVAGTPGLCFTHAVETETRNTLSIATIAIHRVR